MINNYNQNNWTRCCSSCVNVPHYLHYKLQIILQLYGGFVVVTSGTLGLVRFFMLFWANRRLTIRQSQQTAAPSITVHRSLWNVDSESLRKILKLAEMRLDKKFTEIYTGSNTTKWIPHGENRLWRVTLFAYLQGKCTFRSVKASRDGLAGPDGRPWQGTQPQMCPIIMTNM